MHGDERRKRIIEILTNTTKPISGTALAEIFHISRQVIVQDIALLRAENKNIISTNKGYLLYQTKEHKSLCRRTVCVSHNKDQVLEEFYTIVDLGGTVLNVFVEHELYGQIEASLYVNSRADAYEFTQNMKSSKDKPLNILTDGVHYHTIEAKTEKILDRIEEELKEAGFLQVKE